MSSDTKLKILETSLKLFNTSNTQVSTTNHIAKEMGISPGNLHYHYKNKEHIILELYKKMKSEYILLPDKFPNTLTELFEANKKSFLIQWNYRFFYSELLFLLSKDEQLRKIYTHDAIKQKHRYKLIFQKLNDNKILIFKNNEEMEYLINMILLIEQFWVNFIKIYDDKKPDVNYAIEQIEKTIKPFTLENNNEY